MLTALDDDAEPPCFDPRPHVDLEVERGRAELLEPEPVLLDEVEREPISTGRPGRDHARIQLELLARLHDVREWRTHAVPDDRVPERVEPVVRELDAHAAARLPRGAACVLEPDTRLRRQSRTRLAELVGEPAHRERAGRHGMLPDTLHFGG